MAFLFILFILAPFLPPVAPNVRRLFALSPYWTPLCLWDILAVRLVDEPPSHQFTAELWAKVWSFNQQPCPTWFCLWLRWPFRCHKALSVPISATSEGHRFISYLSAITATRPTLALSSATRLREIDGFICKCSHCATHADINSQLIRGAL